MGLFDLFRRKPARPPADLLADLAADQPRCHHYTLAHAALRQLAHAQPLMYLGVLASPDADSFLARVFADVSAHCRDREPRPDFDIEQVTVHKGRAARFPCVVVEMPPPTRAVEAYFTAAVLLVDPDETDTPPADAKLRYFTLEKGIDLGGPPRTILCEWTADGSHLNYGTGPQPELSAFLLAVEEKLTVRK